MYFDLTNVHENCSEDMVLDFFQVSFQSITVRKVTADTWRRRVSSGAGCRRRRLTSRCWTCRTRTAPTSLSGSRTTYLSQRHIVIDRWKRSYFVQSFEYIICFGWLQRIPNFESCSPCLFPHFPFGLWREIELEVKCSLDQFSCLQGHELKFTYWTHNSHRWSAEFVTSRRRGWRWPCASSATRRRSRRCLQVYRSQILK